MRSLLDSRKKIDEIDKELVKLFEERMNIVADVANYKKQNHVDVLNTSRENEVVENAINNLNDKKYAEEVADFFNHLMDISKNFQRKAIAEDFISDIKEKHFLNLYETANNVGYSNKINPVSEKAVNAYYDTSVKKTEYTEYKDILKALIDGKIDYAFLAVDSKIREHMENVYRLLETYDNIYIKDKYAIDNELKKVELKKSNSGYINKFIILGKDKFFLKDCNKIDLIVKIDNKSKSFSHLVRYFANYNVHINTIDSKETNSATKEFTVYVNFDGCLEDKNILKMLKGLEGDLPYLRLVGSYRG